MSIDSTSSHRARSWPAILRRPPAAAPPRVQRANWRGRDQVDVRSCLIALLRSGRVSTFRSSVIGHVLRDTLEDELAQEILTGASGEPDRRVGEDQPDAST